MSNVVTDREYDLSLKFVQTAGEIKSPISQIASDVFLATFGWPENIGKKKAKLAIEEMEKKGKIECERVGKNNMLKLVRIKPQAPPTFAPKPKVEIPEVRIHSFRNFPTGRKGSAKKSQKGCAVRDSAETFFWKSGKMLVEILTTKRPDRFVRGECTKSGSHRPEKGKIDIRDHHGDDVSLVFVLTPSQDVTLIYQIKGGKNGKSKAEEFNKTVVLYDDQKHADLKKAYFVDPKNQTTEEHFEWVLDDMVGLSLIDQNFKEEIMRFV